MKKHQSKEKPQEKKIWKKKYKSEATHGLRRKK
jgi:hypothetical protein